MSVRDNLCQEKLDVEAIRADFPILGRRVYDNKPLIYLDNAASAQKPQAVITAMANFMARDYANVHRGLHYLSNTATEKFENARQVVSDFLNAGSKDEIIFTRSATEAINLVANALSFQGIKQDDEIILSLMEHHSNIIPWHFLRERLGVKLRWVKVTKDGQLDIDDFKNAFNAKTRLVTLTHMSNVLGTIVPLAEVIAIAHEHEVPILIDGSQGAVHSAVDVQALDADFYVATGHKLYGPTGIGVLYGKERLLREMEPFNGGGEMINKVTCDGVSYAEPPQKFEAGTPPIIEAIGLAAAITYINDVGRDKIYRYEHELSNYANDVLSELDDIRIIGNTRQKGAIFTFMVGDIHAHDVSTLIDREGVAVRAGTHCVQPLLNYYGLTSSCRASLAFYNTKYEVDALAKAIIKAKSFF